MNDEMQRDDSEQLNYKRAKIFLERKTIVHVSLKNGKFYNGRLSSVQIDFFEIHDRVSGMQIVFFSELKKPLQEYVNEEVGK